MHVTTKLRGHAQSLPVRSTSPKGDLATRRSQLVSVVPEIRVVKIHDRDGFAVVVADCREPQDQVVYIYITERICEKVPLNIIYEDLTTST